MTEEQQGGTTPPAEAIAAAPAPEQTDAAPVAVDDPAESHVMDVAEAGLDTAPEPEAAAETAPEPEAVDEPEQPSEPEAAIEAAPEPEAGEPQAAVETAPELEAGEPQAAADDEPQAAADEVIPEGADATVDAVQDDELAHAPAAEIDPLPTRLTGPEPTTMEELLAEQDADIKSFKHGDVVDGIVVRIDKDEILVDIGAKSEGVVSNRELFGKHGESQPALAIGDTVLVYVLQPESPEGHVVLSLRRAGLERKWRSMQEQLDAGVIIEAPVIDHNKGGLIVDCGIRGFVPISQIVDFPRRPQNDQPRDAAQEIAEKLMPFVGRKLRLKILEVNRKANRLILSEKVALYEERREKRDELFSSLQVGQKVTGTVRSIAPFGVFIDLGGIDGLVHKSELSWNKVNNPEAGYEVGEEVEAEVIDINHERGRISLSIRRLQPDPWHSTVADFNVGDVIDGTVTKLVNFGAFVRVRDGLEGLIHISELSHQRVAHPGDVVHEGQPLKLKIISLDSERHRLGLSLKQAEEAPVKTMPEPGVAPIPAPRAERRPRPERERERSYAASDAVQEPEGGMDTTLAAAFAGVREQLAAAEAATEPAATEATMDLQDAPEREPEVAETAEAAPAPEPESESVEATPEPDADVAKAEADPEAAEAAPEPEAAELAPEPEAVELVPEPELAPEPEAVAGVADEPETADAVPGPDPENAKRVIDSEPAAGDEAVIGEPETA